MKMIFFALITIFGMASFAGPISSGGHQEDPPTSLINNSKNFYESVLNKKLPMNCGYVKDDSILNLQIQFLQPSKFGEANIFVLTEQGVVQQFKLKTKGVVMSSGDLAKNVVEFFSETEPNTIVFRYWIESALFDVEVDVKTTSPTLLKNQVLRCGVNKYFL